MIEKEIIHQLFQRFGDLKVLVIGDVMIDAYLWGKVDRISPEAPVPVVALKKRENRLGGAANVALNIQSLGANPVLCSVIGKDEKGTQFLNLLEQRGMSAEGILESSQRLTTVKFRIIGNNAQLLRVDEEHEHDLTEGETLALFDRIRRIVKAGNINVIIFEDYDKGIITPGLIQQVFALAHENGIPVVVDPKKKNFLHYQGSDLFKPNLKELREGLKLDIEPETPASILKVLKPLQEKLKAKMILATLSDKGIIYQVNTESGEPLFKHIPAHLRQVADVSGAGDTVISVAALCIATGASPELTARLANLAGGLVCEQVGVVPINRSHLMEEALAILCT